jgi:hypothetical protein
MMSSPFQGAEIPGMASMNDPLGFVKKLWGDMQLPGMVTPTVSIDELDKKIKDLKTVESWLNVNMNMLRGTIQAMEVQRATIATLKSMGESFAQQMNTASNAAGFAAAPEAPKSNAGWPMPAQEAGPVKAAKSPEPPKAEPAPEPKTETVKTEAADKGESNAPFANPAAWWGLLQDQFKQAVSNAMENDPTVAASKTKATATSTTAKAPAKPPAKAAVKTAAKKTSAAPKAAKAPKVPSKRAAPK